MKNKNSFLINQMTEMSSLKLLNLYFELKSLLSNMIYEQREYLYSGGTYDLTSRMNPCTCKHYWVINKV